MLAVAPVVLVVAIAVLVPVCLALLVMPRRT